MILRILPAVLLLPLLGSCSPVASLLAARDASGPAPRQVGPLVVGQTWTVSGPVDSRTVTATVNVLDLTDVPDGTATVSGRDQADAFSSGRVGFGVATFNQDRRTLRFDWIGDGGAQYTCMIDTLNSAPYAGRLTMKSGNRIANGSCTATP